MLRTSLAVGVSTFFGISVWCMTSVFALGATLSVGTEPRQTYEAFGFSITSFITGTGPKYAGFSENMLTMMYEDLHANMLRMWVTPAEPDDEISIFKTVMVDNGVYDDAVRHGVKYFFTAPEGYKHYNAPEAYARGLADMNETIVKDFGLDMLYAVGTENEPGCGNRKHMSAEEGKRLVVTLREELAARGLGHLKILSPDFCQNNSYAKSWIDSVSSDPKGNAAYDYVSTHSYGATADEEMYRLVEKYDKEGWWQTEAGGGESANSTGAAAGAAGRFISDLNHGVGYWVWFLGCCGGKAHHLFSGNEKPNMHYHYFKLINEALTHGTVMRHSTLDGREMGKSRRGGTAVNAAFGVRPDGRWAAALINDGGSATLSIKIPELNDVASLAFDRCRIKGTSRRCDGTTEFVGGSGDVSVATDEVVTLVAREATEPVAETGAATDATGGTSGSTRDTAAATDVQCHQITSADAAQVAPGFGMPFNVLSSSRELLMSVSCSSNGARLGVGTGNTLQYIYQYAYSWRDNAWQQVTLSGTNRIGGWFVGSAEGPLPQTASELSSNNFVVAYVCTWRPAQQSWACGCRDQVCAQGLWQLQLFKRSAG